MKLSCLNEVAAPTVDIKVQPAKTEESMQLLSVFQFVGRSYMSV